MRITLNQEEIHEAVHAYVRTQINLAENQEVSIDFTAGRGEKGLTATIDVRNKSTKTSKPITRSVGPHGEEPDPAIEAEPETETQAEEEKEAEAPKAEKEKKPETAPKGKLFQTKNKPAKDMSEDEDDDAPDAVEDKLSPPAESIFGKKTA